MKTNSIDINDTQLSNNINENQLSNNYAFEIIYKKGKHNMVVDALSRKEEDVKGLLCAISIPQSDWVEEARK
jgi:hypothetical protein